jgi:transposase
LEQDTHYRELVKLVLPEEIFEYFEIINLDISPDSVHVYLDEQDRKPERFTHQKLTSKGFHTEVVIQDFPIRKKAVLLHVRRRRWLVEKTGEVVSREWDSVAEGTRYTKSFADFLKGLFGQLPNQRQKP